MTTAAFRRADFTQFWQLHLKKAPVDDLCTVYKNSECCGEAAPATTGILCNHQCVVSMRQKMLPVRCNKKSAIKHLLVYQEKNPK